jgi:hypothetical protein
MMADCVEVLEMMMGEESRRGVKIFQRELRGK